MITAASITTGVSLISPANTSRAWAVFQNNSTAGIYVKFDPSATALTTANGILISANGGILRLDKSNDSITPFANPIYAIATAAATLIYHDSI